MSDRPTLVLNAVLRVFKPAVRLLLQNGVSYGALAAALKRVFVEAAQDELKARDMAQTDSAITLLSGVHRRDVRTLLRATPAVDDAPREPLSMASEIVARWISDRTWLDARRRPRKLPRGVADHGFDALVASVSSDIRPRAVLDELKRLGVAQEDEEGISLVTAGFAPQQGFDETSWMIADNLHDHWMAAALNLQEQRNFLEQSVHVDAITAESADELQRAAAASWKQVQRSYLTLAQKHFDDDARAAPAARRTMRARFGVYFLIDRDKES